MSASFLITFREGLEAFLIVGIILSYLTRCNIKRYNKWVYLGAGLGLVCAFLIALLFQNYYTAFESKVGEIYLKIFIMGLAIIILTYMVIWMTYNSYQIRNKIEKDLVLAVSTSSIFSLVFMGYIAILREGVETILFLGALYANNMDTPIFYGGMIGLLVSMLVTIAIFKGMRSLSLKLFFNITGTLVMLIAGGLLVNMVGIMQDIHLIPVVKPNLFDLSWLIMDSSKVGGLLNALFGYTHSPNLIQVVSYISYFIIIIIVHLYIRKKDNAKAKRQRFIHNNILLFLLVLLTLLLHANTRIVFAYNYAEADDPMALVFKSAVVAAKEGNWQEVSKLVQKGVSLQNAHLFEADYLVPRIEKAINDKDVSKTAELFANLVYLSIREKLHQNVKEDINNYKISKARLQLAYKSYIDIIDGNIKKQDASRSEAIIEQFNIALNSIGNPGLFGIGKRLPDVDKYNRAVRTIEGLIIKTFPSFER